MSILAEIRNAVTAGLEQAARHFDFTVESSVMDCAPGVVTGGETRNGRNRVAAARRSGRREEGWR